MDAALRSGPVSAALPSASLDLTRAARTGEPEVILGQSKTPDQIAELVGALLDAGVTPVIATRCSTAHAAAVPDAAYDPVSRLLVAREQRLDPALGRVVIACAGTGDLPVATEAIGTLHAFGIVTEALVDIGVAGLHRVLDALPKLRSADVIVAVAGMEAALPTVIAGLVPAPIVAVPTSVGYGAAYEGVTALLGMLASCAPGVAVVNIDNGFGAAMVARRILLSRRPA